jgi:hypothetical protein
MNDDMGYDLILAVGELTLPQWQNWLARYNTVLGERERRIEKLEAELHSCFHRIEELQAALLVYANEDHWFGDKFEPIMFPEGECKCCYEHFSDQGNIARKALDAE